MEKGIGIRCGRCGRPTTTTSKAEVYRCPGCGSQIPVQTGAQIRPVPQSYDYSSYGHGHGHGVFSMSTQNKCLPNYGDGKRGGFQNKGVNRMITPAPAGGFEPAAAGRKRALVVGVSYRHQKKYKLSGTLTDAKTMRDFLMRRYGFRSDDILMLMDDNATTPPTKKNMEEGLRWLVDGCRAGDSLVFYFSGHGINQIDYLQDELDGLDECLCPMDFSSEGIILDNHLNAVLVRPLPPGVVLHAIVDACHSGTILDLRWVYKPQERSIWKDNSPPSKARNKDTSGGLAISLGACGDDQMAADTSAFSNRGMTGAMTSCLIQALDRNPRLSYHQLLLQMQEDMAKARASRSRILDSILRRKIIIQDPLLSTSAQFDVHQSFML